VKRIGRELSVRYVLEGSVRRSAARVRVIAQLLDAESASHIWAERYDRDLTDIFEIQDEIAKSVVASTQTQLILYEGAEAERRPELDLNVWVKAKRGWKAFYSLSRNGLFESQSVGRQIIASDPTSPEGYKLLGGTNAHLMFMGYVARNVPLLGEALEASQRAVQIFEADEQSQWILGLVLATFSDRHSEAEAAYRRALEINPNFSLAYGSLGTLLAYAGRPDESIANTMIAIRLNPRDPSIFFRYSGLAIAHFLKGEYDRACEWAQRSVAQKPDWWVGRALFAASLVETGKLEAATKTVLELRQSMPELSLATLPLEPVRPASARATFYAALRKAGVPDV
jgi:adenylate cyclase